jgi:hypothetical protein
MGFALVGVVVLVHESIVVAMLCLVFDNRVSFDMDLNEMLTRSVLTGMSVFAALSLANISAQNENTPSEAR